MTKKTKKQKEEIARRYKAGEPIKILAFEYEYLSYQTRRKYLRCKK